VPKRRGPFCFAAGATLAWDGSRHRSEPRPRSGSECQARKRRNEIGRTVLPAKSLPGGRADPGLSPTRARIDDDPSTAKIVGKNGNLSRKIRPMPMSSNPPLSVPYNDDRDCIVSAPFFLMLCLSYVSSVPWFHHRAKLAGSPLGASWAIRPSRKCQFAPRQIVMATKLDVLCIGDRESHWALKDIRVG